MIRLPDDAGGGKAPRFAPGELVRHRRYGYRGVVVERDPRCQASDAWYHANQTQPEKEQPWYHVLVHDAPHVTYAAESSLAADQEGGEVRHPLVARYFSAFVEGRYVRNDVPWGEEG